MGHPFLHDAVEMPLVQRDHKVQTLSPQSPDDPFADRIGYGRPYWRFDHVQPHVTYGLVNVFGEDGMPVMDENAVYVVSRNGFAELLQGPLRRGMGCDIDVKEPPAGMLNDHKHVEYAKRRRDHHTEVTGHYALGMIADERGPALGLMILTLTSHAVARYVFAHRSRRDLQTELEPQFIGDPLLAPGWVIAGHLSNERLQLSGDARAAGF